MNILQRALIEKTGHENVLPDQGDFVLLGSARHCAQANIAITGDKWLLEITSAISELLTTELRRSFCSIPRQDRNFVVKSSDELAELLRRAAKLAQALPNQAANDYEALVQNELAKFPANTIIKTEIERMVRQRVGQNTF